MSIFDNKVEIDWEYERKLLRDKFYIAAGDYGWGWHTASLTPKKGYESEYTDCYIYSLHFLLLRLHETYQKEFWIKDTKIKGLDWDYFQRYINNVLEKIKIPTMIFPEHNISTGTLEPITMYIIPYGAWLILKDRAYKFLDKLVDIHTEE